MKRFNTLRLILGDQLNRQHSWFSQPSEDVLYVIAELPQEVGYVAHHKQKIAAFFLAMSSFSESLQNAGYSVEYITLEHALYQNKAPADVVELLCHLAKKYHCSAIEYQRPDEWRLLNQLREVSIHFGGDVREFDTEHFLLEFDELSEWVQPEKHNRLEYFYRAMRRRFGYLMDDDQPVGGQWNFDHENRNRFSSSDIQDIPELLTFDNNIDSVRERIDNFDSETIGYWPSECDSNDRKDTLDWPINRDQSLELMAYFCESLLPNFGQFQDAMTGQLEHHYGLYHSRLSFSLNCKLIHPKEVIEAAIEAWSKKSTDISLPQVEGFIRQILGWREYVRAFYWVNGNDYKRINVFNADQPLPDFFWDGKTKMKCVSHAVNASLDYAYAHHIQRLMITGNLALLLGVDPDQVDAWYLGIYADAIEWVQLPNTRGMSQFADGGWVATKPYISSGNYINKMSDYCAGCYYRVKKTTGQEACPFNALYWHFVDRHQQQLKRYPRMRMPIASWNKKKPSEQEAIRQWGDQLIAHSDGL